MNMTEVVKTLTLVVLPTGLQRTARRNALVAATTARRSRWERAEAFAALDRMTEDKVQPAAS